MWSDQAISELFAVEAPTRNLILVAFSAYNAMLLAFALGVRLSADGRTALTAIAVLLAGCVLLGVVTDFFAPMHERGTPQGATGAWHARLTGVQVVAIFAMLLCGTRTLSRRFRIASWATIGLQLTLGILVAVLTTDPATDAPSPWFGVTERLLIYSWMGWTVVLASALLRERQFE